MNKKWNRLSFIFFIIILSYLTYSSYQNRVYDWDMPGYLGSIYSWDFPDNSQKVHQLTYSSIKKEAPPEKYHDIISLNVPNRIFEKNHAAFSEQLPYYQIKVGYNFAIYTLYKIGFSGPSSILLVNIISYFFCGLLIFFFIKKIFPNSILLSPALSVLILWLPPLREMAENPTPDIVSLVFLLLFVISVFNKNRTFTFLSLFFSILIRPDYIIFALSYLLFMCFYEYFSKDRKKVFSNIFQVIVLTSVYIFIIKYYHYPGWKAVFYDTFIHRRPVISAETAEFSFKQYLDFVLYKLINFKRITLISILITTAIFITSKDYFIRMLSLLVFSNIYFKFLLFPQGGTLRFFLGFVIVLFLILLYGISRKDIKILQMKKIS